MTESVLPTPSPRRRPWKLILAALMVTLLLAAALLAVRAVRAANAARAALTELRALQAMDLATLTTLDPTALADLHDRFARLEANFAVIDREAGPLLPLAKPVGRLAGYEAEAAAAPALLQLAQSAATAGRASMDGLLPLAAAVKDPAAEGSALARLTAALQQTQPSWQEAEGALAQMAASRSQVNLAQIDPRIAGQMEQLDRYLPLLQTGSTLARLAPALLGSNGTRTYLLLAQNSDELRPTGGFISGAGLVQIDQGELGELDFVDSYAIYNPEIDHPLAPPDLEQTMGSQMLLFRDANWSADYPTSASVAQALFQLDTGATTDGVIAFDLEATQRIVAALEPLELPGYPEPLAAGNVLTAMRQIWADPLATENTVAEAGQSDWWLYRKDFMGDLAGAARARLESGQVDLGRLAQALYTSLQEKHVLVTVNDAATAELLAQAGWSGALNPGAGDYLMVVDSNVGWNKVNGVVQRTTHYSVAPQADGSLLAELELVYHHQGAASDEPCEHVARYGDSYEAMIRRCYFNYIRVLVPAGAQLLDAQGFEPAEVSSRAGEAGTTQLSGSLVVPAGATGRVRLRYHLPAGLLDGDTYRLLVQKQPGTPAWPVKVVLVAPPGELWRPVAPGGQQTEQGVQLFFELNRDTTVVIERQTENAEP
jgi:hypothetical protein